MTRRSLALAVLSGILLSASFPTIDLNFLAWLGLFPLLAALKEQTVKQAFRLGGITGMVFFAGTVYWVTNSVHVYGHIPLIPASLITLLLCAYCAFYTALFCSAVAHLRLSRPVLAFIATPALWTALELARTYVFSGIPWSLLGYSQYANLPVIQIADKTGVYGISFLIILVNAAIAEIIEDQRRYQPFVIASAVMIAVFGYGYYRMHTLDGTGSIRIAIVQGNIEQDKKWGPAYQAEVIKTYERLTVKALKQRPDLVIWPETATPFYFEGADDPSPALTDDLRKFARSTGAYLLFGSPTYEKKDRRHLLKNSAFLLDRNGMTKTVYNKIHLVPFGEYVPLKSSLLFFVEKMVQPVGDFQPGTEYTVMKVRLPTGQDVAMGTVICYEIIFPDLVRRFVNAGATVMATITNDAWFGRTGAPHQHFSMAVLRAVENRVPIVRAANTGISGFIDEKGRILETSDIFTEAHLTRTLTPSMGTKTFYTRYGDVFAWLCVFAAAAALIPRLRRP